MTDTDIEAIKADITIIINNFKKANKTEAARALWRLLNHSGATKSAAYVDYLMASPK